MREEGTGEIERVLRSKQEAFHAANRQARREGRRLLIQREDGEIERILCYPWEKNGENA